MARERSERSERSSGSTRSVPRQAATGLTIADLRHLIALMQESDIEEIEVERETSDLHLVLRKPAPVAMPVDPGERETVTGAEMIPVETAAPPATEPAPTDPEEELLPVTAPLVGLFHHGAKPGAPPLVAEGDVVRSGQVVGTIETLNVFNEVEAGKAGRVVKVVAAEGQPVEYGQVLLQIDPLATQAT